MTKIKICGITNLEDGLAAAELGAGFLGFIFSKHSPRRIEVREAARIIRSLPKNVATVGLFVNQRELIVKLVSKECRLDYLQLHGDESPHYCQRISKKSRIIKAFRIKDKEDLKAIPDYEVDMYLLDGYSRVKFGGSGSKFDWDLAVESKKFNKPIILAGGLGPENVAEAVKKVRPYAVDVSSGTEKSPGRKDHRLIKKFIEQVRSADAAR